MGSLSLIVLVVFGLMAWFWQDSLRAREKAIKAAAQACRGLQAQLLDQTVALESLRPARHANGHLFLRRIYGFDFSVAGYERRHGRAIMAGQYLEQLQLDSGDNTTIEML